MARKKEKFYGYVVQDEYGVANNWDVCQSKVLGKKSPKYKSFLTKEEAIAFVKSTLELKGEIFVMEKLATFEHLASSESPENQTNKLSDVDECLVSESFINEIDQAIGNQDDDEIAHSSQPTTLSPGEAPPNPQLFSSIDEQDPTSTGHFNQHSFLKSMAAEIRKLKEDFKLIEIHIAGSLQNSKNNDESVLIKDSLTTNRELVNLNSALECTVKELQDKLKTTTHAYEHKIKDLENRLMLSQNENSSLLTVIKTLGRDLLSEQENSTKDSRTRNASEAKQSTINSDTGRPSHAEEKPINENSSRRKKGDKGSSLASGTRTKSSSTPSGNPLSTSHEAQYQSNKEQKTVILGDSMVKHLNGWKMNKRAGGKVYVKTFAGATTCDMKHYVRPTVESKPSKIIIHAGTNDLYQYNAREIAERLVDIGNYIEQESPETDICMSEIIERHDHPDLNDKLKETNKIVRKFCNQHGWTFIRHTNITKASLNNSGLHLNQSGTLQLAANFIEIIGNSGRSVGRQIDLTSTD